MESPHPLNHIFANNKEWAEKIQQKDPEFFAKLSQQQKPAYLWIGCADSRVPANEIMGLLPGEVFVHRNVANIVVHTDLNCLSVIEFAVDVLKVRHIMVVGHYGCSGVRAALSGMRLGLSENWLQHVQDVRMKHERRMQCVSGEAAQCDHLCELNVIEQASNVCRNTIVRDAWSRGQEVTVHAFIYGLKDGLIRNLHYMVSNPEEVKPAYERAMASLTR